MRIIPSFASLALVCLLTGCLYRMPIQQGNYLDPATIAQVKVGMTHSQVRYLLGTPMVPATFDDSRWDYDYYLRARRLQTPDRSHVTVYFANDLVTKVDSNVTRAPFASSNAGSALAPGLR